MASIVAQRLSYCLISLLSGARPLRTPYARSSCTTRPRCAARRRWPHGHGRVRGDHCHCPSRPRYSASRSRVSGPRCTATTTPSGPTSTLVGRPRTAKARSATAFGSSRIGKVTPISAAKARAFSSSSCERVVHAQHHDLAGDARQVQSRHFFATGQAPRGPEVHKHRLSAIVGQSDLASVQGLERQLRRGHAGPDASPGLDHACAGDRGKGLRCESGAPGCGTGPPISRCASIHTRAMARITSKTPAAANRPRLRDDIA